MTHRLMLAVTPYVYDYLHKLIASTRLGVQLHNGSIDMSNISLLRNDPEGDETIEERVDNLEDFVTESITQQGELLRVQSELIKTLTAQLAQQKRHNDVVVNCSITTPDEIRRSDDASRAVLSRAGVAGRLTPRQG